MSKKNLMLSLALLAILVGPFSASAFTSIGGTTNDRNTWRPGTGTSGSHDWDRNRTGDRDHRWDNDRDRDHRGDWGNWDRYRHGRWDRRNWMGYNWGAYNWRMYPPVANVLGGVVVASSPNSILVQADNGATYMVGTIRAAALNRLRMPMPKYAIKNGDRVIIAGVMRENIVYATTISDLSA